MFDLVQVKKINFTFDIYLTRGEEEDSECLQTLGQLDIGTSEEEDSGTKEEIRGDTDREKEDGIKKQVKGDADGEKEDNEQEYDGEDEDDTDKVMLFDVEMVSSVGNGEEDDETEEAILLLEDLRLAAPKILLKFLESKITIKSG